jgi:malonate transporter MadL subunit
MVIYGVSLLAFCMLVGSICGILLGRLMGINANVGGVGISMILLIFLANTSLFEFKMKPMTQDGITFWSAMYIPIVVAMASNQNVSGAINGGWMAFTAGSLAVLASFSVIPLLTKLAGSDNVD